VKYHGFPSYITAYSVKYHGEGDPFAEGFSPTVATVEPVFPFPSVNRVKSAIADAIS
jgi:hypothetical protein